MRTIFKRHLRCLISLAVFCFLASSPERAQAQGAAPSLFGIKEIVIMPTQINNPKAAEDCGITRTDILDTLTNVFKSADVPAIDINEAPPSIAEIPRISLRPEIALINNGQGLDCTSWISLSAENKHNLIIPPIAIPKSVQIVYWKEGAITSSTQSAHGQIVYGIVKKLAESFTKQYKASQPQKIR